MKNRRSGLTLMEVLVAISLLSLLSVAILTSLRVGAAAWGKANDSLMLDRRIATANAIFHSALENILPVYAEFQQGPVASPVVFLFFQGQPESMRFVTGYSLQGGPRAGLRLMELQVVDGPRGKRVLLNERPYGGPRAAGSLVTGASPDPSAGELRLFFAPIEPQPNSFVIADELEGCMFSYLLQETPYDAGRWVSVWQRLTAIPGAVSIQMAGRADSARLRPVTVTAPIRSRLRPLA